MNSISCLVSFSLRTNAFFIFGTQLKLASSHKDMLWSKWKITNDSATFSLDSVRQSLRTSYFTIKDDEILLLRWKQVCFKPVELHHGHHRCFKRYGHHRRFGKFFKSKLLFLKYIWFLIQNVLKTWKMKNEKNKVKTTYNYLQRKYCK